MNPKELPEMKRLFRLTLVNILLCSFSLCWADDGENISNQMKEKQPADAAHQNAAKGPPPKGNKDQFHLFNPTPKDRMREMSTDRPDKTESAYTVDAGHYQMEMDILSYSFDRNNPEKTDTRVTGWTVTAMNLKAGLLNNVDLQFIIPPYNWEWTKTRTDEDSDGVEEIATEEKDGFGDVVTRLKINLWGNDEGKTAFAFMPSMKIPTNQNQLGNNSVEGGIILPLAVELPFGWGMGVMTQFDFNRNSLYNGHHVEYVNTITFSHDIIGNLAGYVEFFSSVSAEPAVPGWVGTFDCGLTYALSENIQLDAGVNLGVTRAADDWNPFIGISVRY